LPRWPRSATRGRTRSAAWRWRNVIRRRLSTWRNRANLGGARFSWTSWQKGVGGARRLPSLSTLTFLGLLAGIACGILFGEYCAPLERVGDAFVGLLRMTVLPFIVVSTIANLGKLSRNRSRRLAAVGGSVLVGLWAIGLCTVAALSMSFPEWKAGSFFSIARIEPPPEIDFLEIFIPSNIFRSLSENHVPGVILLCACLGLALGHMRKRRILVAQLDVLSQALIKVSAAVTRLSPLGVFAIAASTAGTVTLDEVGRLQAYLLAYAVGSVLIGALIMPLLITSFTPLRYRDVLLVGKTAVVTVFATGKLIIVLPLLVSETERLFGELEKGNDKQSDPNIEVLYPLGYAFPHVGKLLALVFIPFSFRITEGIALGFISFAVLKLFKGDAKKVPLLVWIFAIIFILRYLFFDIK